MASSVPTAPGKPLCSSCLQGFWFLPADAFFGKGRGWKRRTAQSRRLPFLRCEALLDRRVETLSLGQKKKASLLCGLCAGARLILMDEPEGGLDLKESLQYRTGLLTDAAIFVGSFLAAFFLGSGSSLTSFYRADATQGIMLLLIGYLF